MPYSLRHVITGKYLTASRDWTDDRNAALQFDTAADAIKFRSQSALEWVVVDPPTDDAGNAPSRR